MANSKVVLADGRTLIDLTGDTIAPEAVDAGVTFHDAAGEPQVGTKTNPVITLTAGVLTII